MDFKLFVESTVSILLLAAYLLHFGIAYSRHNELLELEGATARFDRLPTGTTWIFLLTTIGLPLFCSLCASWATNPIIIPAGTDISSLLPLPFFNLAISVFVLMITIEIGYLYNDGTSSWKGFIIAALILDIIALLTFLVVVKPPASVILDNSPLMIVFFSLVAFGSLASSCGTIYFAKIHSVINAH